MYKIDFKNEKNGKLYFYEKREGNGVKGTLLEFAYMEPENPDIYFKTEDGDINRWPKDQLPEFLLNLYNKIITELFDGRIDLKSKSSKPRFGLRISAKEINLIHFFIVNMGLLDALKFLGIKYQFGVKKAQGSLLSVKIDDKKDNYLSFFAEDAKQEYMLNGLRDGMKQSFPVTKDKVNDKDLYDSYLKLKGGNFVRDLQRAKISFIDITTAKILKLYDMPSDIMELFGKFIPNYLLNGAVKEHSDLATQRVRMSEAISQSVYKALQMAINSVKNTKEATNSDSLKLNVDPYQVVNRLGDEGMLQYTKTTNPIEELMLSTKITKTGVGNPKADQIVLKTRDLNQSYYGVIAPVSTNEYGGIGSNQTLANKMTINDRFGSIMLKEFTDDINPFELLSASESLQPFYEYDDTTRRVMGNQQFGQFTQIKNGDEPMVQTGFEAIVPQLVSDRFAIKAKKPGRITKVTQEEIIIHNQDGTETTYNVREGRSRTKRGVFLPLKYIVFAKDGQRVKKDDVLAATSSLKTGKLASGRNLVVAQMSYRGMNYEDGWVMSQEASQKYENNIQEKLVIMIPLGAKVTDLNIQKGKITKPGDKLITFTSDRGVDLENFESEDDDDDNVLSGVEYSGKNVNYYSPGGEITDVIIKLNDKNVDPTVSSEWKKLSKDIGQRQKDCQLLKHDQEEYVDCISAIDNTEILKIGNHKVNGNLFDGSIVEVFLEKENEVANGSKFVLAATGGKGTVQYLIPRDMAPVGVDSKLKIEFIPTPLSIISRKNVSILLLMYSGKVVYFLNKKIKEMNSEANIDKIRDLLIEIFSYLDASKDQFIINETMAFFDSKNKKEIVKYIENSDILARPAFPLLVPPHKNKITIKNIQNAANALGVKLNEKVRIPEEDGVVTEKEVPVGIMQVNLLEHFPKAMSGARGSLSVKRQFTTGQGRSGTSQGAGAIKIGGYDIFAMGFKEPGLIFKELHGLRSDNKEGRSKLSRLVAKEKQMPDVADIKITSSGSMAKHLVDVFFNGAMIETEF